MSDEALFPSYIPRRSEEDQIREIAEQVSPGGHSRAILLYGRGGVGKTWLVRRLAEANGSAPRTVWIGPIDIDDSEYWLLSNLERRIATTLDPNNEIGYFAPYLDYLSRLPRYTRRNVGHETVISHLGQIKRVFIECYQRFIRDSNKTVVIIFDTVEAIRGMDLLVTLTQLMKVLPGTLFVLSGRPVQDGSGNISDGDNKLDRIRNELEDPHQGIPVTTIWLDDFPQDAAFAYIEHSGVASALAPVEKENLVRLTRGHPLWLAFAVSYLRDRGVPKEVALPPDRVAELIPYRGDLSTEGHALQEAFNRRLVAPYRETDFWHEAIKRLAVARESVSLSIWRALMEDRPLPEGVATLDDAWPRLLETPWIRARANSQYVTLHDVAAEELAQRIIPLHEFGREWRHQLWQRAARIYGDRIEIREEELDAEQAALAETQSVLDARPVADFQDLAPTREERAYIEAIAKFDVERREVDQFKAVRLHYFLLSDFPAGCRLFLDLLAHAKDEHDVLFQELLAFEMERFLPNGTAYPVGDVVGEVVEEFRTWLRGDGRELYLEVGLSMADYLIKSEQPRSAIDLLEQLPEASASHRQRFWLGNLRGNALMRIPGEVRNGLRHFQVALAEASSIEGVDQPKLLAKAYKELGFYYRNEGLWDEADDAYRNARDAISRILSATSSEEDREEMASIQTNWAYVKGLCGSYREGANLVESAIAVRHRLSRLQEEGASWSVCGEVYRYERRFEMAWKAYAEAEQIFDRLRNWAWLGLIYQEQAICLFQAAQDGSTLIADGDQLHRAKRLILRSLDLCRDLAVRGYPSALNRAGRIFGEDQPTAGLQYLAEGIRFARQLSDGWFWFANLIEYVELSYRLWDENRQPAYLDLIASRADEIGQAMDEYEFPDLQGRWRLIQGHLAVQNWQATGEVSLLDAALQSYKDGFAQIAQQHVGSSGASAIAGEFKKFGTLIWRLPTDIRAQWQEEFRRAWSGSDTGSTLLLARLEELY